MPSTKNSEKTIGDRIYEKTVQDLPVETGVVLVDHEGIIKRFNLGAGYLWHFPTENLRSIIDEHVIGEHFTILVPSEYRDIHDLYFSKTKAKAVQLGDRLSLDFKTMSAGRDIPLLTRDGTKQLAKLTFQAFYQDDKDKAETILAVASATSEAGASLIISFSTYLEKAFNDPTIVKLKKHAKTISLGITVFKVGSGVVGFLGAAFIGIKTLILDALHLSTPEEAQIELQQASSDNGFIKIQLTAMAQAIASESNSSPIRTFFFIYSKGEDGTNLESFSDEFQWTMQGINSIPGINYPITKYINGTKTPTFQQRRLNTLSNAKECLVTRVNDIDPRDELRDAFESSLTKAQMVCPVPVNRGLGAIAVEFAEEEFDEEITKALLYQYGAILDTLIESGSDRSSGS